MSPLISVLIDPISKLIDKLIPDADAAVKAKQELLKEENSLMLEQLRLALQADSNQTAINQEEAKNPQLFVSGWRPFIGWVCGFAFAYHYVLQPFLAFVLVASGRNISLPQFNMEALVTVLFGMLGLGGLRTVEKIRGVGK